MNLFNNPETEVEVVEPTQPVISKVDKPYEAKAFLNFEASVDVMVEGKLTTLKFRPIGAKFTHKWVHENPDLWDALQLVDDVHTKFVPEYRLIKGEELSRSELNKLMDTLPKELRALYETTQAMSQVDQFTRYVQVVGDLYIKTKKGNILLDGIFAPSFDFRAGMEAKYLDKQLQLIAAVLKKQEVKFTPVSFEVVTEKQPVAISLEDLV